MRWSLGFVLWLLLPAPGGVLQGGNMPHSCLPSVCLPTMPALAPATRRPALPLHTTLLQVRSGGVFGGHDYGTRWPLVKEAVDAWVAEVGLELHVIGPADTALEPAADNDCCPSWFVVKP